MLILLWFAPVLTGWASDDLSSPFLVKSWDTENGLPTASVTALARTSDGFLWVGTVSGLTKFDGARFLEDTSSELHLLRDKEIVSLVADSQGGLWVATRPAGLFRVAHGAVEQVAVERAAREGAINDMTLDSTGKLVIATDGLGVLRKSPGGWQRCGSVGDLPKGPVRRVVCDAAGVLWCQAGSRLLREREEKWEAVQDLDKLGVKVGAIAAARQGGLWVAASSGEPKSTLWHRVFYIRPDGTVNEAPPCPRLVANTRSDLTAFGEDEAGNLWVGTYGGGIHYRAPGSPWQLLRAEGPLAELIVNTIQDDSEGSVWIGLASGGLHLVRPRVVDVLRLPAAARQNIVLGACATADGSVWFGTDGAGLFRWRDGEFTRYDTTEGLGSHQIGVMLEDRRTNFWVGTWNGLYRFRSNRFEQVPALRSISTVVQSLKEDHLGRLWIGLADRVICMDAGKARVYGSAEGLPATGILALEEDAEGSIWAAVPAIGLYRLREGRFERYAAGQWPEEKNVRALLSDPGGGLWIACYQKGLLRLKNGQLKRWTTADGLPDMGIHAIVEDDHQNLWMASDGGILSCSKAALEAYVPGESPPILFRRVSVEDGMTLKVCTGYAQPVVARSADGRFWFPSRQTVTVFNPGDLHASDVLRPATVEQVVADGKTLPGAENGLARASSRVRRYEFHFTSPNLSAGERLQFRYRLAGVEDKWVDGGRDRVAYYGHLAPGRYKFHVVVGGQEGVWSSGEKGLVMEVIPQWWEHRWLQTLAVLAVVAAIAAAGWGVARARARRKLRQLELKAEVERERRRIAQDLHDELGAGLTELMLLAEAAGRKEASASEVESRTARIASRAQALSATTDEIVWTLNPRNDSLRNLVGYLSDFGQTFLRSSPVRCRFDIPEDLPEYAIGAGLRHNLLLAYKEALNNVVKHAAATEVWVRIRVQGAELNVIVEDNGRGFDPQSTPVSGEGLANLRDRMSAVGGRTEIARGPAGGAAVRFILPLEI